MRKLKLTLYPPPGHIGQGQSVSYDQQEFDVDDTFALDVLDDAWFQFETADGDEIAIPTRNIAGIALKAE